MAKDTVIKFTKEQILNSKKYGKFYVLTELLKDNQEYTHAEIDEMLAVYGRKAGNE